jgi:hypothetical protein
MKFIEYNGIKYYPNGSGNYFYNRFKVALHRQIWIDNYGEIPKKYVIHHIDGDTTNNVLENLQCLLNIKHRTMGWSKPKKSLICKYCGKNYKAHRGNFCSNKCWQNYQYLNKKYHEEKKCVICGDSFKSKKSDKTETCSCSCAAKLRWTKIKTK